MIRAFMPSANACSIARNNNIFTEHITILREGSLLANRHFINPSRVGQYCFQLLDKRIYFIFMNCNARHMRKFEHFFFGDEGHGSS